MRKGHAKLLIAIVASVTVLSQGASAKGDKAGTKPMQQTATGKHYKNTTLTTNKPKAPVANRHAIDKAAAKTKDQFIKIEGVKGESKDKDHECKTCDN